MRGWLAVASLTAATFAVTAAEMLPVGLLTLIGDGLHVSEGSAGLTVTLAGIVAALAAPGVPLAVGRLDRRLSLAGLALLLAAANVLSALAPSLEVLLLARVLVGVALGGVWAFAASLAVRLVPPGAVSRALAAVFGGISMATVLAVPTGTFIGEAAGWRAAFAAAAALAVVVAVALAALLPALPAERPVRPGELLRQCGNARLRTGLVFLALLVVGHFSAYTYVRPVLERSAGVSPALLGGLLLAYGVTCFVGNVASGVLAPRRPRAVLLTLGGGTAACVLLLSLVGSLAPSVPPVPAAVAVVLVWGVFYGGVSVGAQAWVLAAAPDSREPAGALFASVFNASIAAGAFVGGRVLDAGSLRAVLLTGAGLALASVVVLTVLPGARRGR